MKDLVKKLNISMKTFPDATSEDAELLRTFSFICMLSYDVYVKKTIIEKLIDHAASENVADNSEKPKKN